MNVQQNDCDSPIKPAIKTRYRLALGCFGFAAGLMVGLPYSHLCSAGSGIIELSAAFGTPVVCALILFSVRQRYLLAIFAVALILLAVHFGCEPYRDWVHGPNSPWPDIR
ncbi:MAG: hypothetical protein KKB51_09420 [Candidatus Riflebacteria bacterium]|nr:hypothetical protein [Candidatus Riflebacteria bacterium]